MRPEPSAIRPRTSVPAGPPLWINGLLLDPGAGTLRRDGALVPLRRKAFHLLCELAARAGQVVSKDALFDRVWAEVAVTEDSLTQAVRDIRAALGDEAGRVLRTVRGRGYLLAEAAPAPAPAPALAPAPAPAASAPEGGTLPAVAVLPFGTGRLDPARGALVDVLADEIAAGLVRFRNLRVLSGFGAAGEGDPLSLLPAGVGYAVTGAAVPSDDGFLLRVRLVEARSGALVMGETFDCGAARLFSARAEIVDRVAGHLHIEIDTRPLPAAGATQSLPAFDHYARGVRASRSDTPGSAGAALAHFRAAVAADPGFALAWSHLAVNELAVADFGAAPPEVVASALDSARRGMELAPDDSRTCSALGYLQCFGGDYAAAEANILRGLDLNPGSFDTICDVVVLHLCRGRAAEALAYLDRMAAVRTARVVHEDTLRGEALYHLGRYSEAADCFLRVWNLSPRRRAFLAAMLAQAGRNDEARAQLRLIATEAPGLDLAAAVARGYTYEHALDGAHLQAGLSKAMSLRP